MDTVNIVDQLRHLFARKLLRAETAECVTVIIGMILLVVGVLMLVTGLLAVVVHVVNTPSRYARPARVHVEKLPQQRVPSSQLGATLLCIGAALMLAGAYLATAPG
jgi:hypothetical protein